MMHQMILSISKQSHPRRERRLPGQRIAWMVIIYIDQIRKMVHTKK